MGFTLARTSKDERCSQCRAYYVDVFDASWAEFSASCDAALNAIASPGECAGFMDDVLAFFLSTDGDAIPQPEADEDDVPTEEIVRATGGAA